MTRRSVIAYAIGLQAFMLVKVLLSSAFYARQDIRTPVKFAVVTVTLNMILNATLIFPLAHAGLALASSLSSWFNAALLGWGLYKRGIYRWQQGWGLFALRLLFSNGLVALFLWWQAGTMATWMHWHWQQRFEHIFLIGMAAIGIYLASCVVKWDALATFESENSGVINSVFARTINIMEFIRGLYNLKPSQRGCVATIGNYDGLHFRTSTTVARINGKGQRIKIASFSYYF